MSLHDLAHSMQAKGRNGDSVLVHMSPNEVHGLQALAMAHGGSLTTNPETGLPEASFLSSILPTVIGAGLTIASGGALSPLMAAGITGAGYGLATGSLKQGLMAGLGAYGGAGLGEGLMTVGMTPSTMTAPEMYHNQLFTPTASTAIPSSATAPITSASAASASPMQAAIKSGLPIQDTLYSAKPVIGTETMIGAPVNTSAAIAKAPGWSEFTKGIGNTYSGGMEGLKGLYAQLPTGTLPALGLSLASAMQGKPSTPAAANPGLIRPYEFSRVQNPEAYASQGYATQPMPGTPFDSSERRYFTDTYTALKPYKAPGPEYAASGGLMGLNSFDQGGAVEKMSDLNTVGANTNYPMANIQTPMYSNPMAQYPSSTNVLSPSSDAGVETYSGAPTFADGGISHLGDYSDGGRLLRGPGDGVSDDIPASIGDRQPARLADGEFVVPARIVSELGNGSTEAGARKLYAMMDRVQNARRKSVGKDKVAVNSKADKHLPA